MRPNVRNAVLAATAVALAAAVVLLRACGPEQTSPQFAPSANRAEPSRAPPRARTRPDETPPPEVEPANPGAPPDVAATAPEDQKPKLRIHGRVLDESNAGVAGAEVEIRAWSGKEPDVQWFTVKVFADAGGAFEREVERERASMGFGLATTAKGHVEGWKSVKLEEYDESRGVDVVAEAARAIAGRVIDAEGRPIPGTTVQLWYGSETTWPTQVDAEGRFRSPPHAPRREFELVVEAPGHASRRIPVAAAASELTDVGDIVFRRGGWVSGVVVDSRGQPVQDLWLVVNRTADKDHPAPRARTDTAGRFRFDDLDPEKVTVYVDAPDNFGGPEGSRRRWHGGLEDVEVGRADLRLVAQADTTVWLQFVDADTRRPVDVKKAEYAMRDAGTPEPERLGLGASGSGALVSTVLSVPSGRRYDLTVRAAGFEDAHVDGVDVGEVAEMRIDVPMRRKP